MFETPIRFGTNHSAGSFFLNQPIASEDETPAFYDENINSPSHVVIFWDGG